MSERPNIVWIVLDTARADAFEPYGAAPGATPAVADLARRGAAAPDVRATASWTLPSHFSMFAGALPRALGLADLAGINALAARPIVEAQRDRWIVERLRQAGYRTSAASANAWLTRYSGFSMGFDEFADVRSQRQAKMASDRRSDRARWLLEAAVARVDDGAAAAEREMARWLAEARVRPFLWFVNLLECHSPYLPPRRYTTLGPRARIAAARDAMDYLTMEAFWRTCLTEQLPSEEALERMRAGYAGAIRYMDAWLERLLVRLDDAGLLEDTLVIVTSDHGENFGEGRLIGHGFSLDERLINIPFVAAGPGATELAGIRSLGELPRRLAAIAGLQDHPYAEEDLPPLPAAQYDSPVPPRGDPRTEDVIVHWRLDEEGVRRLTMSLTAVVEAELKLVVHEGRETFFNLGSDPLEASPLAAQDVDPDAAGRLRAAAAHPAATASLALLGAEREAGAAAGTDAADLEERMRLLGYL